MWNIIFTYLKDFINLLYPSICYACGNHLYDGEAHICLSCRMSLPYTFDENIVDNKTKKIFNGRVRLQAASSLFYFQKKSKVQNLLHYLKYKGSEEVGIVLGEMHGQQLLQSELFLGIDFILPIPLHPNKLKLRGYNQSLLLAKGYANVLQIDCKENVIIRTFDTNSQTRKSRYERAENMKEVFECNLIAEVKGKNILLVDDVITTGSTIASCAEVLIKSGCSGVWVASIAVA